jgi:hypothetical protein
MFVRVTCPKCQQLIRFPEAERDRWKFCPLCSTSLTESPAPAGPAQAAAGSSDRARDAEPVDVIPVDDVVDAVPVDAEPVTARAPLRVPARPRPPARPAPERRPAPSRPAVWSRPWYVCVLALVPLGLPLAAWGLAGLSDQALGWSAALWWSAAGLVGAGFGLLLALPRGLPTGARVGGVLGLIASSYFALAVVWLSGFGRQGIVPSEWAELDSAEGRFRIRMPGTPTREILTRPAPGGLPALTQFSVYRPRDETAFTIGYGELSEDDLRWASFDLRAARVRDNVLWASLPTGRIESERPLSVGGQSGIECVLCDPGRRVVIVRSCQCGNRFYLLTVSGPDTAAVRADARRFMDSFAPTPPPAL